MSVAEQEDGRAPSGVGSVVGHRFEFDAPVVGLFADPLFIVAVGQLNGDVQPGSDAADSGFWQGFGERVDERVTAIAVAGSHAAQVTVRLATGQEVGERVLLDAGGAAVGEELLAGDRGLAGRRAGGDGRGHRDPAHDRPCKVPFLRRQIVRVAAEYSDEIAGREGVIDGSYAEGDDGLLLGVWFEELGELFVVPPEFLTATEDRAPPPPRRRTATSTRVSEGGEVLGHDSYEIVGDIEHQL